MLNTSYYMIVELQKARVQEQTLNTLFAPANGYFQVSMWMAVKQTPNN